MLNDNKIKHPKDQTLEYYKIIKDVDKYVLYNCLGFHLIIQK